MRLVWIKGKPYHAEPIPCDTGRAWRLRKTDGTVYDLRETEDDVTCDCPWESWKGGTTRQRCSHIFALWAEGMLEFPLTDKGPSQ